MAKDAVIKDASFDRRDVERFDRWAGSYDRSFLQERVFDPIHAVLLGALGDVAGRRILDVGSGTGRLTAALAERSAEVVGVDPAPRMVTEARAKAIPGAMFMVASAESLPFADASFDAATASFTLHHWRDAEVGLAELGRVVRPGGHVAIADLDLPRPVRWALRRLRSSHAGWSRDELADLLYRGRFSAVRAMARSPLGPSVAVIAADR
jgi:ubiquinone/menaquinone biosynthesis C-methylase UbiE